MRGHAFGGVDGEAAFYEFARGEGDGAPVFERGEAVVGDEDGLHFFQVRVSVEGGVAAEEEVCYYAYGPDVAGGITSVSGGFEIIGVEEGVSIHWFSVPRLLEDFRSHVPWCAAGCSQDMKCFFVHYPRQAKIRYEQVCVVFWGSK